MPHFKASLVGAAVLTMAGIASADETTFCNTYITTLPYIIATQGHYCFDRNLSTAITNGAAITVNADFVLIDLNNFKLGGGGAGLATNTIGILVNSRSNVTIRSGNIRGFHTGINLDSGTGTPSNNTVENVTIDGNTRFGILVDEGNSRSIIRGNTVLGTGGTTGTSSFTIGIWNQPTTGDTMTRDNVVIGVAPASGGTAVYGIIGNGWVIDNVVTLDPAAATNRTCFGNTPTTIYRDNNASGCNIPYTGLGTDAGGNFPTTF